jgi:hypothetical protein
MPSAWDILNGVTESDEARLSPEWRDEIDRRIEAVVFGKAGPGHDWRIAIDEIRREVEAERKRGNS